jgi:uncharacterized protein with PQ loop repeat
MVTSSFKKLFPRKRHERAKKREQCMFTFNAIMLTMAFLLPMHGEILTKSTDKISPLQVTMHIFSMALLKIASKSFKHNQNHAETCSAQVAR